MEVEMPIHNKVPDMVGVAGQAWRAKPDVPEFAVATWVLYVPHVHPFWSFYLLSAYHLRGDPPPKLYVPNATHEFVLHVLHPDKPVDTVGPFNLLSPVNFAAQLVEASDAGVEIRIRDTVRDVIDGKLPPDTDYRSLWKARFGGAMIKG